MDGALRKWLTGNGHWFFFACLQDVGVSVWAKNRSGPQTRAQMGVEPCFQFGSGSLCGSIFGFLRLVLHDESDDFVPSM